MRKNRPNQVYQAILGIKLSPRMVCALGESALPRVSGLFRWRATAGSAAHEMRKNRPNQVYQAILGIKLSPRMVGALGESALPRVSGV